MNESAVVTYSKESDKIAVISINRPKALNALSDQVYGELIEAMERVRLDQDVHVVIIKGDDKNFVAGADIGIMATATPLEVETYVDKAIRCVQTVYRCDVPVIAYLQGYVLGGGLELALACDIRLAGQGAKLGLPEINLGIIPGSGGTQSLPHLIGNGKAKEMIFTGEMIDAAAAMSLGLVNSVHPDDQLWGATLKLARKLAAKPLQALRKAKVAINAAGDLAIWDGMLFEKQNVLQLFSTHDQKEGMSAFLGKRKPVFTGN